MFLLRVFITVIMVGLFHSTLFAQEVIEVLKPGKIETDDAAGAKQQLMDQAIESASFDSIKGLIGDEKTERSRALITNKIIKNSSKYILSIRGLNFARKGNDFVMDTEMKISLKGLRALLLDQGLLYQMEGPPKVLPVIQIVDRIGGRSYGWWYQSVTKEHGFLTEQLEFMHKALKLELEKIGFYTMSPMDSKFSKSIPDSFRGENLQRADYLFLGDYFKSSMVVRGNIIFRLKPNTENVYLIDIRLEALHSGNGRLMAEVVRTFETDPGSSRSVIAKKLTETTTKVAEDLSAQLSDSWKKGTFGATVLKLAVVGSISPYQLDEFKKTIVLQLHDIKSLRERMIEARKTTFEVDSSVLPQQLAQAIRLTKFSKYKVQVEDVTSEGLTIKVESL